MSRLLLAAFALTACAHHEAGPRRSHAIDRSQSMCAHRLKALCLPSDKPLNTPADCLEAHVVDEQGRDLAGVEVIAIAGGANESGACHTDIDGHCALWSIGPPKTATLVTITPDFPAGAERPTLLVPALPSCVELVVSPQKPR